MSIEGKKFADSAFLPEIFVAKWNKIFDNVMERNESQTIHLSKQCFNNMKCLRAFNCKLHNIDFITEPVIDVEWAVRNKLLH